MLAHHQLIHEFVDGSLSPYLEEILFTELGKSESLRQELRTHMTLQKVAVADSSSIVVPVEARQEIFSMLGLTPSTPQSAASVASRSLTLRFDVLGSLLCLSFALGMIGYHLGAHSPWSTTSYTCLTTKPSTEISEMHSLALQGRTDQQTPAHSSVTSQQIRILDSQQLPAGQALRGQSPRSLATSLSALSSSAMPSATSTLSSLSDDSNSGIAHDNLSSNLITDATTSYITTRQQYNANARVLPTIQQPEPDIAAYFLDVPFRCELRTSSALNSMSSSASTLRNSALSFLYELDEHDFLGFELSNDEFAIRSLTRVAGSTVERTTTEARPSVGIVYRRSLLELDEAQLGSYVQLHVGASSSADIMTRAALGFDWHPRGQLSLTLALCASMLNYRSDNTMRTSWTPSIQYGVGLHF